MSLPARSLRGMSDKRRARRAKQVRRDARRAKKRNEGSADDTFLRDLLRSAMAKHPLELLSGASVVIHTARPDEFEALKSERVDPRNLDRFLANLIATPSRETTALLAVIAELLVDDPARQHRLRQELAQRDEHLPRWIGALPHAEVYRAVRRSHVLGDVDELVLGVRIDDRHELTVAVKIDHNVLSSIVDAGVVPDPIDEALAQVAKTSSDTEVVEMRLADARAWIENALRWPTLVPETEEWPLYRRLVRWLMAFLPEGGQHRSATMDWTPPEELCDGFFSTDAAAPFNDYEHRQLLMELFDTGSGDPLRWSAARVEQAIGRRSYFDDGVPLEVVLDTPDLLRAFIPYAHAQSGIRDELTSETVAAIDALRSSYKREVLREARRWDLDDAV